MVVGLAAVAALPAAIAVAETQDDIELIEAAVGIPVAAVAGIAAIMLARRARRRVQLTLGRARGDGAARIGRALGVIGVCLALTGLLAIGFAELLSALAE